MELLALVLTSPLHASAASIKVGNVTDSTACSNRCLFRGCEFLGCVGTGGLSEMQTSLPGWLRRQIMPETFIIHDNHITNVLFLYAQAPFIVRKQTPPFLFS